jgi:hypothetical protein
MEKAKDERPVREIDPQKMLFKAIAVLAMLAVALIGMCYTGWLLWTLPAKK